MIKKEYKHLRIEDNGQLIICYLSNPPEHTLTAHGMLEIHEFLDSIQDREGLRVLAFTGDGEDVFIKHYEVAELAETAEKNVDLRKENIVQQSAPKELHNFHKMLLKLRDLNSIVVAGINGNTAGGGCEFALGCDLRVMSDGNFFIGLPETSVGILPGGGGTQRLARLIGASRAMDLILHAKLMSNKEALDYGLVSKLLPRESFKSDLLDYCKDLASRAPIALREVKKAIHKGMDTSLEEGLRIEQAAFNTTMQSNDAARAMRSILNKKKEINDPYDFEWKGN